MARPKTWPKETWKIKLRGEKLTYLRTEIWKLDNRPALCRKGKWKEIVGISDPGKLGKLERGERPLLEDDLTNIAIYAGIETSLMEDNCNMDKFKKAVQPKNREADNRIDQTRASKAAPDDHHPIDDLSKKITLNPNDAQAYYARGYARIGTGQFEEAIQDLNKSIALDPENAFSYYLRWAAKVYQGEPDSNNEDLTRAIQKKPGFDWDTFQPIPDNPTALGIRAMVYINNNDFVWAYKDFLKACSLSEKFTESEFAKIEIKGQLTRHFLNGKTIDELSKAVNLCRSMSDPYYRRGKLYLADRKFENAINDFTSAIENNSWFFGNLFEENSDIYFARATAFAKIGKEKESIGDLETYLKHKPDDKKATEILTRLKTDGLGKSYLHI